jgi:hypothetical protein
VLCELVPPPPDDVDTQIQEPNEEAHTLRERLEQHRTEPICAGCHSMIDPPGLVFEGFDSLGVERDNENGYPLDTTGGLDEVLVANARELTELLAVDKRVSACLVKQLYRHANGRLDDPGERKQLQDIDRRFAESGYRFQDLLLELATSEGFRSLQTPEVAQ